MRNYKEPQESVLSGDARAEQLVFLVYLISDNKKSCISFEIQLECAGRDSNPRPHGS